MSIKSQVKHGVFGIAACAALCLAPVAQADFQPTGYAVGSQQFGLSIGGSPNAGGFTGLWNSTPITFWCIELNQYFSFGTHYTYSVSQPSNATFTLLSRLFTEAYGSALTDATHSAAFQLAIWEIVYDSGNLQLGSGQGAFSVLNNHGNGAAVTLAQSWLNGLLATPASVTIYQLSNGSNQDFITASRVPGPTGNVPEPAPIALLLAAMFAGFVVRPALARRKAAASLR